MTWANQLRRWLRPLPPRRMFFACTHVTLRETELPFWLDEGIEVVPEEADTGVLTYSEALGYDDPNRHPVLRACADASTLDPPLYSAVRRARLRQRRGKLDAVEQALFNQCFDAIYVATDLATAVEVRRWFKGEVIFRYFGRFDYLRDIAEMVREQDPELLRGMVCLPIFDSLHELGLANSFGRVATVHGHISPRMMARRWDRKWIGGLAVTVMNGLAPGTRQEELARGLFDLAGRVPMELLGKNAPDQVARDIAAHLSVAGFLDRQTFLERFVAARLLVHPFAERYHNHYTNLEAVAAGLPVVFRTENPLWNEQPAAWRARQDPLRYGAVADDAGRDRLVSQLFDDPVALARLARRQRTLLAPFSARRIRNEIAAAVALLDWQERIPPVDLPVTPLAGIAGAAPLRWQGEAIQQQREVPAAALAREEDWQAVHCDPAGQPVLRIMPKMPMQAFPLGNATPIPPGRYRLEFDLLADPAARLQVRFELYAGSACIASDELVQPVWGRAAIGCEFSCPGDCVAVLWLANPGPGAVDLCTLRLVHEGPATAGAWLRLLDQTAERIAAGLPIAPEMLARGMLIKRLVPMPGGSQALLLPGCGEPWRIVLGEHRPILPGRYGLRLLGSMAGAGRFDATVECLVGTAVVARGAALVEPEEGVLLRAEIDAADGWALLLAPHARAGESLTITGLELIQLAAAGGEPATRIDTDPAGTLLRTGKVAGWRMAPAFRQEDRAGEPFLPLAALPGPLVLGEGAVLPSGRFRLGWQGRDPGMVALALHLELFSHGAVVAAADLIEPVPATDRIRANWTIEAPEQWALAIWPESDPTGAVQCSLTLERLDGAAQQPAIRVANPPLAAWGRGQRVAARHVLPADGALGQSGLRQMNLPGFVGENVAALHCWIDRVDDAAVELVLELWRDNGIAAAVRVEIPASATAQMIAIPVDVPDGTAGLIPVLHGLGSGTARFAAVQALAPASAAG